MFAIRSCRVNTDPRFRVPAMFPSNGFITRHPLTVFPSLHWVATSRTSPASSVLRGCYDCPTLFPSNFVSFVRRLPRLHALFSLARGRMPLRAPGVGNPVSLFFSGNGRGSERLSHVPGASPGAFALLFDSGRFLTSGRCDARMLSHHVTTDRTSTKADFGAQ